MSAGTAGGATVVADGCRIASSHPSLAGHFPGNPVVPGVVLLDEVLSLIRRHYPGQALAGIPAVKFLSPLRPDESFSIRLRPSGAVFHFECVTATRTLARGTLATEAAAEGR